MLDLCLNLQGVIKEVRYSKLMLQQCAFEQKYERPMNVEEDFSLAYSVYEMQSF